MKILHLLSVLAWVASGASAGWGFQRGWGFHRPRFDISNFREERKLNLVREAVEAVLTNGGENPEAARDAIATFFSESYVQHNPSFPNGREAIQELFVDSRAENLTYTIGAVFAEGDFVTIHGRIEGFGPVPIIVFDIFKVRKGQIVEHWDVLQNEVPADQTVSGNAMWPVGNLPVTPISSDEEEANRRVVVEAINRLFGLSDITVLDELFSEDYVQHNPFAPNGLDFFRDVLVGPTAPGDFTYEFGHVTAYGDYVLMHVRIGATPGSPAEAFFPNLLVGVDLFRLEGGRIVEHWDVLAPYTEVEDTVSGNSVWPIY